jgi:hypothetical protein
MFLNSSSRSSRLVLRIVSVECSRDNEEWGPRLSYGGSWICDTPSGSRALRFPPYDGSALRQLLEIAKQGSWQDSLREYMMWQRYIMNYARTRFWVEDWHD